MKKMFMAVIALMMTINASAQFYIYYSDGTVAQIDSISLVAPQEPEFDPIEPTEGVFSVSTSKQVTFSKGNLQYNPANDEWRFAESQLDYIGEANCKLSSTYNGWLDLFAWSTDNPATPFGVSSSKTTSDYYGDFVDWGKNRIENDYPTTWRTLTNNEWHYLLRKRNNATYLRGVAQVNGINGIIILPDNWICPTGITFKSGFHSDFSIEGYALHQTFTSAQWSKMETAGAVFLPAAGDACGSEGDFTQQDGSYWSATEYRGDCAIFFYFSASDEGMTSIDRKYRHSVRLVKDL